MKSVIFFSISLFLIFSWLWIAHVQTADEDLEQSGSDYILSPEALGRFQNEQLPAEKRNKRTLVPTQLSGASLGMTSSFETSPGIETTLGMEYSMPTHSTPVADEQKIDTIGLVLGLGFRDQSRYLNMRGIEFAE